MSTISSVTVVALATALACSTARADDSASIKALEQKLEQSMKTIEALQRRVDLLEHQQAAAPATETLGARVDAVERAVSQVEATTAAAAQVDHGLPIHGFADVGAVARNADAKQNEARGFKVGTFDLYMTPQISDQVKALVELAFEYGNDGTLGVDAERMQLGYVFSDTLTLWGGRFHTPYGYWNTAFHHGAQLQTSIARPRFLDFEDGGGILPAHSVGMWATGGTTTPLGKLNYDLYLTNGDRINAGTLDYQAIGDSDNNLGYGFRTTLAPAGTGWTVGVHGLSQAVHGSNADNTVSGGAQLQMLGSFATYDNDDWEGMLEYYHFNNRDLSGATGTHASQAWYAQLGYNINEAFTPYARYELSSLSSADPYFALQESGKSYRRSVAGLRYNVTPTSALKAELRRTRETGTDGSPSSLSIQYSIRF